MLLEELELMLGEEYMNMNKRDTWWWRCVNKGVEID
jgi:hypothetical protein